MVFVRAGLSERTNHVTKILARNQVSPNPHLGESPLGLKARGKVVGGLGSLGAYQSFQRLH